MAAEQRFLTLADVAEVLNISTSQVYALVRNEQLPAIKIGGRGQWRVERDKLEDYIRRMYDETREFIAAHPFSEAEAASAEATHGGEPGQRD
jgi:excisionase family DNA binding protein